jgi:hypothetical protein
MQHMCALAAAAVNPCCFVGVYVRIAFVIVSAPVFSSAAIRRIPLSATRTSRCGSCRGGDAGLVWAACDTTHAAPRTALI